MTTCVSLAKGPWASASVLALRLSPGSPFLPDTSILDHKHSSLQRNEC